MAEEQVSARGTQARKPKPVPALVIAYPREAVLTTLQVAVALQCTVRSVERQDYPVHYIGRMPRSIWDEVSDAPARSKP